MKTSYFTFGQGHVHRVNGVTFDCDIVVMITAEDPRKVMVDTFGQKWAMESDTLPDLFWYPRGVHELC